MTHILVMNYTELANSVLFFHYVKRFLNFLLSFCFFQSMQELEEISRVQGRF